MRLKRLLIGFFGLIVVAVAAVLIGPSFVDWNSQKSRIAAEVRSLTGRELTIDGDMSLGMLPAPALAASSVRFENIPGGSEPAMIELEELRVRVALLPLLQGRVQFERIALVKPRILLEVLPDGRRNWDFTGAGAVSTDESTRPAGEGGLSSALSFDSFAVEDGTLVYRDAESGTEERFDQVNANVIAETTRGPFALKGSARVRSVATDFDVTLGRLVDSGATRFKVSLGLPGAEAQAALSGTLSLHPDAMAVRGKLEANGKTFASVFAAAMGSGLAGAAGPLKNEFSITAAISGDREQIDVSELALRLGEATLDGSLTVRLGRLGESPRVEAKLTAKRIDVDGLLATGQSASIDGDAANETPQSASEQAAADGKSGPAFALPSGLEADLDVSVDALVYRGQVVRQLRIDAALAGGQGELRKAFALLPGGSDISLSGRLQDSAGGPTFAGHLEAGSDSVRAVLEWLGADVASVPSDRLRKMNLSSDLTIGAKQVSLQNLDLKIDISRVLGGLVVAIRERPGMGVGLAVDRIDLDAYLGAAGGVSGGEPAPNDQAGDDQADSADRTVAPAGWLNAFDANLDLKIGSLSYRGATAEQLRLKGTLQRGAMTFEDASVGNLAGNSGRYVGTLTGLDGNPTVEGALELRIAKPLRLARLAKLDPKPFEALGPFNLNGNIKANLADVAVNARIAALGGQFALDGIVKPLAAPLTFDFYADAKHGNLPKLVNRLSGRQVLGEGLGGIDARARLSGTPRKVTIKGLTGRVGPAQVAGDLTADLGGARPDLSAINLTIAATHANLAQLLTALSLPAVVTPALGDLDLNGKVEGSLADLRLSGLHGHIGPIALSGSLAASLAGSSAALKNVALNLNIQHPNLAKLLAGLSLKTPVSPALGGIDLIGKVSGSGQSLQLSDLKGQIGPIALAGSLTANLAGPTPSVGDVNLNMDIRHPNLAQLAAALGRPGTISPSFGGINVRGHVIGSPEQIEVRDLNGKVGPGDLQGTVTVDLRGAKPDIKLDLRTGPLPIAALLSSAGSAGGATGGAAGGSLSSRWSTRPLDLAAFGMADADVTLKSTALLYDDYRLDDADLRAVLKDGVIDLRKLTGTIYNGAIQLAGKITARNQLNLALGLNAVQVEIGPLLRQAADLDRVSGPVNVNANFASQGVSESELISRLEGQGTFTGTLNFKAKAKEVGGAALLAILGTQIKEVQGLADTSTTLLTAFAGSPSALKGSFGVSRGVVSSTDARLDGRNAFALTQGRADLGAWQINSRTDVYRGNDTQEPYLTAHLTGPLDNPNPRIQGGFLRRQQQDDSTTSQSSPLGPQPSGQQAQPPQEPLQDLEPKDILKGLLKGLQN